MSEKIYEEPRPSITAELRRAVEVESGHCCAIKGCTEHTYLEIHHIDENRENNTLDNLILLCDKHHKMAHAKVIDRKALREYKKLLIDSHNTLILERFDQLEKLLIGEDKPNQPVPKPAERQPVDENIKKLTPDRHEILHFALTHVAITHYEKYHNLYFEHQVEFVRDSDRLLLDAIRQDDELESDIIIDVHYFRKSYMDAPVYASWFEKKIELYELLTGRKARGILLVVTGKKMGIPLTEEGVKNTKRDISLEVYSCDEVGFHPGTVSAALFASNLKEANKPLERNI